MIAAMPPGFRHVGQNRQQPLEIGQLAVDEDAQRLEGSSGRMQLGAGAALDREIASLADDAPSGLPWS